MSTNMKQFISVIFLVCFISACIPSIKDHTQTPTETTSQSIATKMITSQSSAPKPSATATLTLEPSNTPTSTPTPTATIIPSPVPTETPYWGESLRGFEQLLPIDAEPAYEKTWEWIDHRACPSYSYIIFIPYRLSNDKWNIIAIADEDDYSNGPISIYWDWQHEASEIDYWQEIRHLPEPDAWRNPMFLGLDEQGQWWIVWLTGSCESPTGYKMFPVTNPGKASLKIDWLEQEDRWIYWVSDDTRLTMYEWVDDEPVILWTLENIPDFLVYPSWRRDFTGDGKPEIILYWNSGLMQIYQSKGDDFTKIGEIEASYHQYRDVDGDSIGEFLWPIPEEKPTEWKVYGWNGEQFVWKENLSKPVIHSTLVDSPIALPDCPFHLVEVQADESTSYEGSSYNVRNSDESIEWKIPNTFTYVSGYSTFAWDENCQFLIHARADGGSGLYRLDLNSGYVETLVSLPGYGDSRGYGAVQPISLANGDIIFTIQGQDGALYPPLGIYRYTAEGDLQLLADIPPLAPIEENPDLVRYGKLSRLPTGEFVYQSP